MVNVNSIFKYSFLFAFIFLSCDDLTPPSGSVFIDKNNVIHLDSSCTGIKEQIVIEELEYLLEKINFSNIRYCGKCVKKKNYEQLRKYIQDIEVLDEIEYACYDISKSYKKEWLIYDFIEGVKDDVNLMDDVYELCNYYKGEFPVLSKITYKEFNAFWNMYSKLYKEKRCNRVIEMISIQVVE